MADQKQGKVQRKGITGTKQKKVDKKQPVELVLHAPDANSVYVAGDFNKWDDRSIPMKRKNDQEWATVVQLPSGRYEFKYIADGQWVEEVPDMEIVPNSYGTHNFVLNVS